MSAGGEQIRILLSLTTDHSFRPISRAYVYSLVERVKMLEGLLKDQGLPVPPADHPPETRHRSHCSRGTSTSSSTHTLSATSQKRYLTSSELASSPSNSILESADDHQAPEKRPFDLRNMSDEYEHPSKKNRKDSLVVTLNSEVESPKYNPSDSTVNYKTSCDQDQFTATSSSSEVSYWPVTDEHTGSQTISSTTTHNTSHDYPAYSAWNDDTFESQGYIDRLTSIDYGDAIHMGRRHDTTNVLGTGAINLDFMPLGTVNWSL